ncbi:MAG: LytTR family DNA-binding domain-containing protein [Bacteroidota bacterium]
MQSFRIIIIDANPNSVQTITNDLMAHGHQVVGSAASYRAAKALYIGSQPDIVISEVHLTERYAGIEFAQFVLAQPTPKPFIFLTAASDTSTIHLAKQTLPAAYLTKPVRQQTLLATIEIAMYAHQEQEQEKETIRFYNGKQYYQVAIDDILYLRSEHNYVHIKLANTKAILQRASLRDILEKLPEGQFVQTHRSYAVNLEQVDRWDGGQLYVQSNPIPVSRTRRKEIFGTLPLALTAS